MFGDLPAGPVNLESRATRLLTTFRCLARASAFSSLLCVFLPFRHGARDELGNHLS